MNKWQARKLAQYHKFTKKELHDILKEAIDKLPVDYWAKANKVNKIFDNGYYFNQCVKWVDYEEHNTNDNCVEPVVVRVLECFGKFSKIQIPKKEKIDIKIQVSEKPKLND